MIGPFSFASYENATVQLGAGDLVMIYTDGITEATNDRDEDFGAERLRTALASNGRAGANQTADAVLAAVAHWSPGPPQDDRTLVVINVVSTERALSGIEHTFASGFSARSRQHPRRLRGPGDGPAPDAKLAI